MLCLSIAFSFALAVGMAEAQPTLETEDWPAGITEREQLPKQRATDYDFQGVQVDDVEKWLGWFGITLPIDTSGSLTGWLWGQRSAKGLFHFRDYRIEGEIVSPLLELDQWFVKEASMRFGYANGVWYVGRLQGTIGSLETNEEFGHASLASKLPTDEPYQTEIAGTLHKIDLGNLLRSFGIQNKVSTFAGTLDVLAAFPIDKATRISNWNADASLRLKKMAIPGVSPADLEATASLSSGQWTLDDSEIEWGDQQLNLKGDGRFATESPFRFTLTGMDISLASVLHHVGLMDIARQLGGQADLRASVEGDAGTGIKIATANIESKALNYQAYSLEDIRLVARYASNSLQLSIESARFAGGQVTAESAWTSLEQLSTGIPQSLQLTLDGVSLDQSFGALLPVPLTGMASGELKLHSDLRDGKVSWASQGNLDISALSVFDVQLNNANVKWTKELDADQLSSYWIASDHSIEAQMDLEFRDREGIAVRDVELVRYRATGRVDNFHATLPLRSDSTERSPFSATGTFELRGTTDNLLESGFAELQNAELEFMGQNVQLQTAILDVLPSEFRLAQFRLVNERGRIAGSGIIRRDQAGDHQLNLRIAGVEIEPYAKEWLPQELNGLGGIVSLEVRVKKSATEDKLDSAWSGSVHGGVKRLRYRNILIGQLSGEGTLKNNLLDAKLNGSLLGGQASLQGVFPFEILVNPDAESFNRSVQGFEMDANVFDADVERVMSVFSDSRTATSYSGSVSVEAKVKTNEENVVALEARLHVPILQHLRSLIMKDLVSRLEYESGTLRLLELAGGVAGGRIDARGTLRLPSLNSDQTLEGDLIFDARRIKVDDLIRMKFPEYAEQFGGILSYRGSASLNQRLQVFGNANAVNARWYQVPIQNVHGDLRWSVATDGSSFELSSRNMSGMAIGGDFAGEVQLRGFERGVVKARGRINNGKLEQLSKAMGFDHIVGTGRFDGTFDLSSRDAISLSALTGQVQIDFEDGDTQSVPILSDLGRFVPLLALTSSNITNGAMHARIGQGQVHIHDLLLNSDAFWILANGDASLSGGQLDIDALLQTGGGIDEQFSQNILQKLAVEFVPQAMVLAQINDLIRNRTLYFHIDGTTNRPFIRPRAAQTIGRAILQNLRRQWLVIPTIVSSETRE